MSGQSTQKTIWNRIIKALHIENHFRCNVIIRQTAKVRRYISGILAGDDPMGGTHGNRRYI